MSPEATKAMAVVNRAPLRVRSARWVCRGFRAVLNGIATRQRRKGAGYHLVQVTRPRALVLIVGRLKMTLKHGAFVNVRHVVGALVDGLLQQVDVPTVEEIAVEAVPGRITVGQYKRLLVPVPLIIKVLCVIRCLLFSPMRQSVALWKGICAKRIKDRGAHTMKRCIRRLGWLLGQTPLSSPLG